MQPAAIHGFSHLTPSVALCTAQGIAVGQRAMRGRDPEAVMAELGFGRLRLVDSFPVAMAGAHAAARHIADRSLKCAT